MSVAKSSGLAGAAIALGLSFAGLPAIEIATAGTAAADSPDNSGSQTSGASSHTDKAEGPSANGPSKGPRRGAKPHASELAPAAATTGPGTATDGSSASSASRSGAKASQPARRTRTSAPTADAPTPNASAISDDTQLNTAQLNATSRPHSTATALDSTAPDAISSPAAATPSISDTAPAAVTAPSTSHVSAVRVPSANSASATTNVFSGVLSSIQGFFEGALLLVRRALFNQAPTVDPIQITGQSSGPITGTIGGVDPEGEAITYTVTRAPSYGTVALNADGTYTYTPGSDFNGVDAFTVSAADAGLFHINLLDLFREPSTQAVAEVTQGLTGPRVTFNFIYGTGAQFWSSTARTALQTEAILLSSYFVVSEPVTITYAVTGQYQPFTSTLATAGSDLVSSDAGFFQTVVQNKILTGVDSNGVAADGEITWNFANPWAFGNTVSNTEYDFDSTAMHELLHTFGFLSNVDNAGSNTGNNWTMFDSFIVNNADTKVIDPDFDWNTAYNPNLSGNSGGLYFGGPNAVAAYGGPVPLYTPNPWSSGSSMSHLDDSTFTGSNTQLMNAISDTGLGVRTLSPIELGILKDLGYTVVPQGASVFLFFSLALLRRRKNSSAR